MKETVSLSYGKLEGKFRWAKWGAVLGFLLNGGAAGMSLYYRNYSAAISQGVIALLCIIWIFDFHREMLECKEMKERARKLE